MNEADINYSKEAFLHPWNLTFLIVGMGSAFGSTVLSGGGGEIIFNTILLFTGALELLFLGYVPRQERFRNLIRSQKAAKKAKPPSQREIFRVLSRPNQRRYARLRDLERKIDANYRKFSYASQGLLESHMGKIDGLLDSCLTLLSQKERHNMHGQRAQQQEVVKAMAAVRSAMERAAPTVRRIKARRLKVLEQRLERFKKSKEHLEIIEAQIETIEDVVKYIHEQSITLRNPEEITYQLDLLLSEVEDTESSIQQIESVFETHTDFLGGLDLGEDQLDFSESLKPRQQSRE